MAETSLRTLDGGSVAIPEDSLDALRTDVRGDVCLPGESGYDAARTLWNAMIDRRPGLVVRCAGPGDVMKAVRFARQHDLLLAVRGGGHNIAGHAACDGGLMIDLSPMKSVRVDPEARRAWAEPGLSLAELDNETQVHALAVPTGVNSTTGIAGLTLGGGFGWTTRKYGMTVDNLVAADVVTADGELVHTDAERHPDLFWALRGGGGNFGIVTNFEFQLHPVGPEVLSGLIVHPFTRAGELLKGLREIAATAPDELTCWAVLRKAPPLPFLPESVHGTEVLVFALCYLGDMQEGERAVQRIRDLGEPIADVVGPHPFTGWQAAFDPLLQPGARNYWKSHDFRQLDDAAIDVLLDYAGRLPTPDCEIFIAHVGGAMSRVAADATAFSQRDAHFVMNVHTRWQSADDDAACVQWARDFFEATAPYSTGSVYVNFMPDDEADRLPGAYGGNLERLSDVKARYDPANVFRMNQNIAPARSRSAVG